METHQPEHQQRHQHRGRGLRPHHVPEEVGRPVEQWLHAADELHVFGFADPLLDEEDHEARGNEGHGEDDTDRNQNVHRGGYPGDKDQ